MKEIDVTPLINQFDEHLKINDRTIFSARFGDGKTWFLNKFMESRSDKYEFIVLYPVNYQIAPNEAIMEYIKRDILFQLIVKGRLKPGVSIPDSVLFQWYISQKSGVLFNDIMQVMTSLPVVDSKWQAAISTLFTISKEITSKIMGYKQFKSDIESEDDFTKAVSIIENLSFGAGNIYELDMVSYLIIQTLQQIKKEDKETVLVIEDLDRVDPAHLFRILNVFSAHIDRAYQCSDKIFTDAGGNNVAIDNFNNKFGFDKVVMVLDYETTKHIFSHFYGDRANYLGYIGKFISHNVFYYSISSYALSQLMQHMQSKCGFTYNLILNKSKDGAKYVDPKDLSVRLIAQLLDSFEESVDNATIIIEDSTYGFKAFSNLTCTISTLRRLGMPDGRILQFLLEQLADVDLLQLMGGFLLRKQNILQGNSIYYKNKVYSFNSEKIEEGLYRFSNYMDRELRAPENYKFLLANIDEAFFCACKYVK